MARRRKKKKILVHRLIALILLAIFTVYLLVVGGLEIYHRMQPAQSDSESDEKTVEKIEVNDNQKVVVIDAGHGGYDGGSQSVDGINEKDVTLKIALLCGEALESKDENIVVVYTREDDDYYWTNDNQQDLFYRVNVASENNAALFLSIHLNSSEETNEAQGHETWVSLTSRENELFAYRVDEALNTLNYNECRGVKDESTSPLLVLHYNMVPSVLVELGYINNVEDFGYINSDEGSSAIANALADAMIATLNDIENE